MKTISVILLTAVLTGRPAPAAAQSGWPAQVEGIASYARALAAEALGNALAAGDQARDDRLRTREQRQRDRAATDRGPQVTEVVTRTIRLGRDGRLELENLSGDVEIAGGGGDEVTMTATKRLHSANEAAARAALSAMAIDVSERPGVVRIVAQPTRGRAGAASVDYVIRVPAGTSLALKTVSGDVTVRNVSGELQLSSLAGDVAVTDAKPRGIDVEVVSGDVSLEQVDSDRVRVNAISGDILFRGRLARTGRYDLRTHSGDIQLVTERDASFDVEAGTFSGDVTSDFALTIRGRGLASPLAPGGGRGPRRNGDLRGTASDGGAQLSLHSFSGDIALRKR